MASGLKKVIVVSMLPTVQPLKGVRLHQWSCSNSNINQSWKIEPTDGGWLRYISQRSGKCISVEGASTSNSARIIQLTCDGSHNRQLKFE